MKIKTIITLIALTYSGNLLADTINGSDSLIYRYKDEKGNFVYSDSFPSQNKQDYDLLSSKSGVLKKTVEKELTKEELQNRKEDLDKINSEASISIDQRKKDTELLSTYSNINEIDKMKSFEINQIETVIKSDADAIINIKDKMDQIIKSTDRKDRTKINPDLEKLSAELNTTDNNMQKNKDLLKSRSQKYEDDKKRYQQILTEMSTIKNQ